MSGRPGVGVGSLVAALLAIVVGSPSTADSTDIEALLKALDLRSYRHGTRPPPFSGPTLDDQQLSLADLQDKVVIVNFWASWCRECRPEMPALERLHRGRAAQGLAVIGINARENRAAVGRYAKELGLTFPLLLDPSGHINAQYGVVGLPATFIVGRDGRAVALAVGPRDWVSGPARALIEALLAEPPASRPR
jgi:cytochrome c biogenesis protein CcmG, thiol:disulfide interchange protein DsbE